MSILVIVESPAKCKKIEEFLGINVTCVPTFGHLRKISRLEDTDYTNNFKNIKYSIIDAARQKQINIIKKELKLSTEVILATDDDREGESIAWHICDIFNLPISTTKRVIFHEITQSAVQKAFNNATTLNMATIYAQQAREIMDIMIGFIISPILWKFFDKNTNKKRDKQILAAGRCQTPSLKLVYENHINSSANDTKLEYKTVGYFTSLNLPFELTHNFSTQEEANNFLTTYGNSSFKYNITNPKRGLTKAPEPLNTASLQQLANNQLRISPSDTMKYAQQLYEYGYITYMRTESKKYNSEFISTIKQYIERQIGGNYDKYISKNLEKITTNDADTGAHECIHPVNIFTSPDDIKEVHPRAIQLYKIIWKISIQSCMTSVQYQYVTASANTNCNQLSRPLYTFQYKAEQELFAGWKIIETEKYTAPLSPDYTHLLTIANDSSIDAKQMKSTFFVRNIGSHYSEACLVNKLEKLGIGKPSTFSTLIEKIQEYKYVKKRHGCGTKISANDLCIDLANSTEIQIINQTRSFGDEKNKLFIEPLGISVIKFLLEHFATLFEYDYVKLMENDLKTIETDADRIKICVDCYDKLNLLTNSCNKAIALTNKDTNECKNKLNIKIDDTHTLILGKYGLVIKAMQKSSHKVTFIPVKPSIKIEDIDDTQPYTLEDLIDTEKYTISNNIASAEQVKPIGYLGRYKNCDLLIKKGVYGIYAEWGDEKLNLNNELGNSNISDITYADVYKILEKDGVFNPKVPINLVRQISDTISIRSGQYGDYIFYKKKQVKKPFFYKLNDFKQDYKKCDKNLLVEWIKNTYGIE